ncbi:MAG: acyl-CoA dehydrogenase [Clostridia bacterium]|nr:acyl-CoA dehydrogenase [Clostridia bacterium]
MDFSYSPEDEAFRQELRAWVEAHLPEGWHEREVKEPYDLDEAIALRRWWERQLAEGGWLGLSWPREYGGRGAPFIHQVIFQEEMARVEAPEPFNLLGVEMLGPTLILYGTEEQKRRFLPPMLRCEEMWCEGFSEPNAGSDLASLQTRAERHGDRFVVNGQKIWTSYAQYSDWCFLLARTNPSVPKHKGISMLLVDMRSPGVTVEPIRQITGRSRFNTVFFENVEVPVENVVGGVDDGWQVAMTLLGFERGTANIFRQVRFRREVEALIELAKSQRRGGRPAIADPEIRRELAQAYIEVEIMKWTLYRALSRLIKGESLGPEASIIKLFWSEMHQRMMDLALRLQGVRGQLLRGSAGAVAGGVWQHRYLESRAETIYAGSSEIQRNILGERVLGLPK